jgi:iron complex transport system substrate-binding protein
MSMPRTLAVAAIGAVSLLAIAGCSAPADAEPSEQTAAEDYYPVTVIDMAGNEVTIESADSVAVTDNRFFQVAAEPARRRRGDPQHRHARRARFRADRRRRS